MNDRVLVTGGAGFIGSHVVDALIDSGREVLVLDSLLQSTHDDRPGYLNEHADYIWGDLRDPETVDDAIDGVGAIFHHAGVVGLEKSFADVVAYVSNNDLGSAQLLRALHVSGWSGPLVLASSMVVYGEGAYTCESHGRVRPGSRTTDRLRKGKFEACCPRCGQDLIPSPVDEKEAVDPRSIYAATKAHQEHLFAAFGKAHDIPVMRLRYHNVYGPRMPLNTSYAGVAAVFRNALQNGGRPEVFEDGGQLRDFVHVRDVAAANMAALEAEIDGAFNIATGKPKSILDMAAAMATEIDASLIPVVTASFRSGDVRHIFASPDRARELLGWRARIEFSEGMSELAADRSATSSGVC